MTFYDLLAQGVGIAAMLFNIFSYQQRKRAAVISFQFFGALLFSVNLFMLGGTIGGILNVIAAFRAIVFFFKEKFSAEKIVWQFVFGTLFVLSYVLTFVVFKTEWNLTNAVIELLPVIGLFATTISFRFQDAATIRKFALISSPSWLVYNCFHFAVGAILCEVFSIVSVGIGILRYDINKKNK